MPEHNDREETNDGYFCAELCDFCDGNFGCIFCPIRVNVGVGM